MKAIEQMQEGKIASTLGQRSLAKEQLAKIENMAYVYVEARLKQKVETPLTELLQAAHAKNKEIVIASSKDTENLMGIY
ncbi:hypothetical protein Aasi_1332 [Candidatus Amoebophilus asiaticus 5a2]|uniref:Uncharacterized protein n=1 Tax=Amoebophilus asiaticus (strain 5a2) TaxID=452471 RepID=B3ETU0_AMOA5|nr:hypothetical protein [Candidatus Amoebophilus asiaticus]ACE06642.1 hypothetical protein Aasi_1332 [Candidatus Amoebophilus asiaticus 5a2]